MEKKLNMKEKIWILVGIFLLIWLVLDTLKILSSTYNKVVIILILILLIVGIKDIILLFRK